MVEAEDKFDALLRRSLASKPEVESTADFAGRALADAAGLRSVDWPALIAIAAMLVALIVGAVRLLTIQALTSLPVETMSSSSNQVVGYLPIGGAALLLVIAWLMARDTFTIDTRV